MKTLKTRKLLGCLLATVYFTFVVAGSVLGCCCSTAADEVASVSATHGCAHSSSKAPLVPQHHGNVCDGIPVVH